MNHLQIVSPELINASYDKKRVYKVTEEEVKLFDSMRTPLNDHIIDETISKTLALEKYKQVAQTFGSNLFEAEKELDSYRVIVNTQKEEIDVLKSYVCLDQKEEQERKIKELKMRQDQQLIDIAGSDRSFDEKVVYLSNKLRERERVKRLTN